MIRDYTHAKFYGFDPVVWDREHLVDVVIPTPRWNRGDSGMPIGEWKKLLPSTQITAGIETAVCFQEESGMVFATEEIVRGLSASYLASGSDGIYFFNYFVNPLYTGNGKDIFTPDPHPYIRNISVLSSCYDNIYNRPVRFAVISQSHEGYAKYPPLWEPLPAKLSGEKKSFEITTGKIPPDKKAFLIFGVENYSGSVKISFNGDLCTSYDDVDLSFIPGIGSQTSNYVNSKTRCFKCDISHDLTDDMTQLITVESDAQTDILNWLEIVVV